MNNNEIFKDIRGYEGYYQITNFGRVYSLITNKFLALNHKRSGYVTAVLFKNKIAKTFTVHRLVATNFIDNPNQYRDINHKDGNKTNNNVWNLEWVTSQQNTKHAFDNNLGNFRDNALFVLKRINEKTSYKIVIFKKGNELIQFDSVSKAADTLHLKRDNITHAIRKKHKISGYEVFGYKVANEESLQCLVETDLVGNSINE